MLKDDRHMRKTLSFILTIMLYSYSFGQTPTKLYNKKNYRELVKLEKKSDKLKPDELFMVGFAFFIREENNNKAIEFYDMAIAKGLDNGSVHFYKGLSLFYLGKYDDALKEVELALKKEPSNQEFMNQKGLIYLNKGDDDNALVFFEQATKLPNTNGESFYWVAYIYQKKQDLRKALDLYYIALDSVPKTNGYYLSTLQSIGQLEYTFTKDLLKSAKAFTQVITINPRGFDYYSKLIMAYNGAKEFSKADSIFALMKVAYHKEYGEWRLQQFEIDEYEWNGQKVRVFKYLSDPKECLDYSYRVILLTKLGDKVERTFIVQMTYQEQYGTKYMLCEEDRRTSSHITFLYGWDTFIISLNELKKVVGLVLDGKIKPITPSNLEK